MASGATVDQRKFRVFLSYARLDIVFAAELVETMSSHGLDVWWDPNLTVGLAFPQSLEAEIERSDGVVVLWTKNSVKSRWVCEEAALAAEREKFYPVTLDGVRPPFGYRTFHSVQVSTLVCANWSLVATEVQKSLTKRHLGGLKRTLVRAVALPNQARHRAVRAAYFLTFGIALLYWMRTNAWLIAKFYPLTGREEIALSAMTLFAHLLVWLFLVQLGRLLTSWWRYANARLQAMP